MELSNEVLKLSIMTAGKVMPIHQGDDVTYLVRDVSGYGVAIPFEDDRVFNEPFVGITLSTNFLNYNNESFKVLYLYMIDTGDLKKFSYIAAEFIDIQNRSSILHNPYSWVDAWNEMFGNAKKKYMISDVVSELAALKTVFEKDKSAKWMGPKDGTHDIVYEGGVVEVKSTTNKTNTYVSINSRFQIDPNINEKIYFVRLEPKPYCESIDSLVADLIKLGYPEKELEENLILMGYRAGNRTRKTTYQILSINSYDVTNEYFPVISVEQLNDLASTKIITGFKLTLDLSSIPNESIK